jgi:hypothetical protein
LEEACKALVENATAICRPTRSSPAALLGLHTVALGAEFYEGTIFPEEYRNQLFVARHSPWNRTIKDEGGDVVVAKLDDQAGVAALEPSMTGLLQNKPVFCRTTTISAGRSVSKSWRTARCWSRTTRTARLQERRAAGVRAGDGRGHGHDPRFSDPRPRHFLAPFDPEAD